MDNLALVNKENLMETDVPKEELVLTRVTTFNNEPMYVHKKIEPYLIKLFADGKKEGLHLCVTSSYRDIKQQEMLYDNGRNKYATFPGASEHHTGLAVDIEVDYISYEELLNNTYDFESTPEFAWLNNNAHKYGFILRYLKGKEDITGINYEPWHYRFVGIDNAEKIKKSGLCLKEYLQK